MKLPQFFRFSFLGLLLLALLLLVFHGRRSFTSRDWKKLKPLMDKQREKSLKIKPNDLLTISVSAPEQTAALPFNLPVIGVPQGGMDMGMAVYGRQQLQTYLVEENGEIDFPVLGR